MLEQDNSQRRGSPSSAGLRPHLLPQGEKEEARLAVGETHVPSRPEKRDRTLVIACGALARELLAVKALNGLDHLDVKCLPASLHNRPQLIPEAVRARIRQGRRTHDRILCLYADCGTGGALDRVLAEEGVERIEGEHCYAFYLGIEDFAAEHEAEIGTFYLTDYLVRHFERLVVQGLGLDRHPQLRDAYFGHYVRVLYLAQTEDETLTARAMAAAERLGLAFARRVTGFGGLDRFLVRTAAVGG